MRQDSLSNQLKDLIKLSNEKGMYDASDWINDRINDKLMKIESSEFQHIEFRAEEAYQEKHFVIIHPSHILSLIKAMKVKRMKELDLKEINDSLNLLKEYIKTEIE